MLLGTNLARGEETGRQPLEARGRPARRAEGVLASACWNEQVARRGRLAVHLWQQTEREKARGGAVGNVSFVRLPGWVRRT